MSQQKPCPPENAIKLELEQRGVGVNGVVDAVRADQRSQALRIVKGHLGNRDKG
jgi:hypothetical protein